MITSLAIAEWLPGRSSAAIGQARRRAERISDEVGMRPTVEGGRNGFLSAG
jgi:hypothetical protein